MSDFKYLFGPVPSRRFGLSLGVELIPHKTCTLDCVFCEVGTTTHRTLSRKEYVPTGEVLKELTDWFALGLPVDFITVTGAGEPTLHTRFGEVLAAIRARKRAGVRSALLTNSTLLYLPEVRAAAVQADVVKVSFSAWDQASFGALTRPHAGLSFDSLVAGLRGFRQDYCGELWMEVFLVPGINALQNQVAAIAALARTINPDRIHLNTAVRPTAEQDVVALPESQLRALAGCFTPPAEVIARFAPGGVLAHNSARHSVSRETGARPEARRADQATVLAMLRRRPCTAADLVHAFAFGREEAGAILCKLAAQHRVCSEVRNGETYYVAVQSGKSALNRC